VVVLADADTGSPALPQARALAFSRLLQLVVDLVDADTESPAPQALA